MVEADVGSDEPPWKGAINSEDGGLSGVVTSTIQ